MPVKAYDTKADFDADYSFGGQAVNEPMPPAGVEFLGNEIILDAEWTRPRVGGHLMITVGKGHPNNRSLVQITGINNNIYTVDGPPFEPEVADNPKIRYHRRPIKMNYDAPKMRPGTHRFIEGLVTRTLAIPLTDSIVMAGTGIGWEVERLVELGYDVVGFDDSPWVQNNKDTDHTPELEQLLVNAGYDPTVGEGAMILAEWTARPRVEVPAKVLDEDASTNGSRNKIIRELQKDNADWGIAVGVLPALTDSEVTELDGHAQSLVTNRVYYQNMDTSKGKPPFIWRTRAQIEALIAPGATLLGPE